MVNDSPQLETRRPVFAAESRDVPDVIVGQIPEESSTVTEKLAPVEIITAPSAFDQNEDMDFGRSHLYGPDAKQSRSEPMMKVVSLKQVFQVSPDLHGDSGHRMIPPPPAPFKEKSKKPNVSYVSFSPPTQESSFPGSDHLVPLSSRVSTEMMSSHPDVKSLAPPNDPKPVRVIPFLAEDAVSKELQNQSIFVGIFRKRPSTSVPPPLARPSASAKPGSCLVSGTSYQNGESISKLDPCRLCRCFYGKELCHLQSCPDPPSDTCRAERMPGYCCPRYTCGEHTEDNAEIVVGKIPPTTGAVTVTQETSPHHPGRWTTGVKITSSTPVTTPTESTSTQRPPSSEAITTVQKHDSTQWQTTLVRTIEPEISTDPPTNTTPNVKTSEITTATPTNRIVVSTERSAEQQSSVGDADNSLWGLLRVSGCNIYGKFYKLNEPVTELSGPCNSCVCSVHGVECNALC